MTKMSSQTFHKFTLGSQRVSVSYDDRRLDRTFINLYTPEYPPTIRPYGKLAWLPSRESKHLLPLPPLAPPSHVRGGGNDVLLQRALHLVDVEMASEPAVEHGVRLAPATAVKTTANGGGVGGHSNARP